jgi:hypothetical protein
MNTWLDWLVVSGAVIASAAYVIYALGPKRIRAVYSRFATKYFGLRAARWFASSGHSCHDCAANPHISAPSAKRR